MAAAAAVLRQGGVVAFPTETVYGLAVRHGDPKAKARLVRVKQRPARRPFQLLLSSRRRVGELCDALPDAAVNLLRAFWPGPLTLVLKGTNGQWLGLRTPDHTVARDLARRAGGVLVATSANISGEEPALTAADVARELEGQVDFVIDGGRVRLGVASSVVRVSAAGWELLREGAISQRRITAAAGCLPRKKRNVR